MRSKVAFVGIGQMGWPMAARLASDGHEVAVFDVTPGRCAAFVEQHEGEEIPSVTEVPHYGDIIITMLPTSRHVLDVVDQMLVSLRPGQVLVEMSSGLPASTQDIARKLADLQVAVVDAPVSGGVQRALSGDLAIMTGGEPDILEDVMPILQSMGSTITRIGGVGAGQAMKALNNLVSAGGFLIAIEALSIGQKFGLDPGVMTDVLNASTGSNNSTQKKVRQFVLSRKFDSGFGLDLMVKDLTIALEIARTGHVPSPFSGLCRELAASAASFLGPGHDHTALAQYCEAVTGVRLLDATSYT